MFGPHGPFYAAVRLVKLGFGLPMAILFARNGTTPAFKFAYPIHGSQSLLYRRTVVSMGFPQYPTRQQIIYCETSDEE